MKALAVIIGLGLLVAIASCQSEQQIEYNRYYSAGSLVYQTHCQNCHGDGGQGLAALIPPLTDSRYLIGNLHQLPCYLQNGLNGPIIVNNKNYEGKMPPADLSPIEIAQVLTYITNSFGNNNGLTDADKVEKDLKVCR
jgi:mono/diheme cytochrome c family protein